MATAKYEMALVDNVECILGWAWEGLGADQGHGPKSQS